jgi:DNA-binding MarR family transcriptional regulator
LNAAQYLQRFALQTVSNLYFSARRTGALQFGVIMAAVPAGERGGQQIDLACLPRLLGFNLRRAHQCCWRQYAAAVGEQQLRPGLFGLLVLVTANPGIAQIELGTHLGIDKASIVALLDRLEQAGLLARRRSTRDRRRQGVFPTERGSAALAAMLAEVRAVERRMASRFTRAEFAQLLDFLRRLHG